MSTQSNQLIKLDFDKEQVDLIKKQIAPNANDSELKLFLNQCRRTGLDPLTRQIYCIHRGGKMTIQTSIDGFRVIAERSGSYAGQDEPIFQDDEKGVPVKCTIKVYRFSADGQRYCAGVGVAYYKEYYPMPANLQKSMPHTMIAKVAEALALRKAFPQDLSGLYTGDEIRESDAKPEQTVDGEATQNPYMANSNFEKFIARVEAGEEGVIEKAQGLYSFTAEQMDRIDKALLTPQN